jgi:cytidine deaminase
MLNSNDQALVQEARALIARRFKPDYHHIAAALRTRSGQVFSAVHLEATVGRIAVCAEAVAIGMAATAGDTDIDTIVAVDRHGHIVPPCGMCRELISDYSADCRVILAEDRVVSVRDLLPEKYSRRAE